MLKERVSVRTLAYIGTAVLILILMEHAQRDPQFGQYEKSKRVLILILMEHAQRVHSLMPKRPVFLS